MKTAETESTGNVSPIDAWILAVRPKTLPASVSPVVIGIAAARHDNQFAVLPALAAMAGAMLLQIGVNLANDYFDYQKGVDTAARLGPVRVTQSGLIAPARVKLAMIASLLGAAVVGLYLLKAAGWPVLIIGIASILAALAYSGGPYPLASHGMGDIFVFIFFGPVAVCGTYYVQALQLPRQVVWLSVPIGLLITAIIVVNNLRDISTDAGSGKKTLAVILGARRTRLEFVVLLAGAFGTPAALYLFAGFSGWVLLPLLSLPVSIPVLRSVHRNEGALLNRTLVQTAALALLYSLLLAAGLLISP